MSRIRSFALGVASLGLVLSMTACAPATTDANAAYCTSSAAVQSEVVKLKTLATNSSATLDQLAAQRNEVAKAATAAAKDAEKLGDEVKKEIIAADNAFDMAIKAIPGSATVQEASTAYQAAIDAWDKAMLSIRTKVGCK
jgi:hypothetical protein